MLFQESETVEFKEVVVDDIKKGCVQRGYMSDKDILLSPPLTRQSAV